MAKATAPRRATPIHKSFDWGALDCVTSALMVSSNAARSPHGNRHAVVVADQIKFPRSVAPSPERARRCLCAAVFRGCDLAEARSQRGAGRLSPFTRRQSRPRLAGAARVRAARALALGWSRIIRRLASRALTQGLLQRDRPMVLLEQIGKRLIGQVLEILHGVPAQQLQRVPGFVVDLNALAGHQRSRRPPRSRSPRSPWPGLAAVFALVRRSVASARPTSSLSSKRPASSRRT